MVLPPDIRHQDTCLEYVKETILNRPTLEESQESFLEEPLVTSRERRTTATAKLPEKSKAPEIARGKFEMNLPGHFILSGELFKVCLINFERPTDNNAQPRSRNVFVQGFLVSL